MSTSATSLSNLSASSLDSIYSSAANETSLSNITAGDSSAVTSSSLDTALDSEMSSIGTDIQDTDLSSSSSSLLSDIEGALSSPLGELAAYGGLTAYGLSTAESAQQQNQSYADQLQTQAQSYLSTASTLQSQVSAGTLPSWAQTIVNFDTTEGQDIINSGQALQTIANQNFAQYSSGQLKPADQTALTEQVQAEQQQVASQLAAGGDVDSSVLSAYNQQIQQNASITQQQILNSYYTTGDQAYNSWLTSTSAGAALMNQGSQFAQTTFQNMMTDALGLDQIGMSGLTTAISLEVQSNDTLSQEVSNLMSNMAAAYAYTMSGPGGSGSSGSSSGGGLTSLISSLLGKGSNLLSSFSSSGIASDAAADTSAAASDVGSDVASTIAQDESDLSSVGDDALSSLLSSEGFSAAGGAAATGASLADPALQSISTDAVEEAADVGEASATAAVSDSALSAGSSLAGTAGTALGVAGSALSLANEVSSWKAGATGSDALGGAETGASVGATIGNIVPGIGTLIGGAAGAVIGGIAGAISSIFGSSQDPENKAWDGGLASLLSSNPSAASYLTAPQAIQGLQGAVEASNDSPGHALNLEVAFGKGSVNKIVTTMTGWINQAIQANPSLKTASASQLYTQVVVPKLQAMGAYDSSSAIITNTGTKNNNATGSLLTQIISLWQSGTLTSSTNVGIAGQTISGLQAYGA